MPEACSVCCTDYGKLAARQRVVCPNAACESMKPDAGICKACLKSYFIKTLGHSEPHCMTCKRAYKHVEIYALFPASWLRGEYAKHRSEVLFERQRAMLPATTEAAMREREKREIQLRLSGLRAEREAVNKELGELKRLKIGSLIEASKNARNEVRAAKGDEKAEAVKRLADITERIKAFREGKAEREAHAIELHNRSFRAKQAIDECHLALREGAYGSVAPPEGAKTFIIPCPGDGCRAFLVGKWTCDMCGAKVCRSCRAIMPSGKHECDPETVESVKAIAAETKPCPKCHVPIFKISGCHQMFCTMCQVAFSWATGRIETGPIHNPHYFEYMHARAAGDVPGVCDLDAQFERASRWLISCGGDWMRNLRYVVGHIEHQIMPMRGADRFEALRVAYLLNEVTEDEWKRRLAIVERDMEWRAANNALLATLVQVVKESTVLLYNSLSSTGTKTSEWLFDELDGLCKYLDAEAKELARIFKRTPSVFEFERNFPHGRPQIHVSAYGNRVLM